MQLLLPGAALIIIGLAVLLWPKRRETDGKLKENFTKVSKDGSEMNSGNNGRTAKTKGGGVIMIGPIPIVFGSDPNTTLAMMIVALAMMVFWLLAANI